MQKGNANYNDDAKTSKSLWEVFILNGFPPYTMPTRGIIQKWFPVIKLDGNWWCDDILDIALILSYIKWQNTCQSSTYGSELVAMHIA